jgi:hypothetical protein
MLQRAIYLQVVIEFPKRLIMVETGGESLIGEFFEPSVTG